MIIQLINPYGASITVMVIVEDETCLLEEEYGSVK